MNSFDETETVPDLQRARLPTGVSDYFWSDAFERRQLETRILNLFRSWGYNDVISPTYEFSETFTDRADDSLAAETYRFLDRDGSTLALRVDMTIPIARLVGTRLYDVPMPQRFCYAGNVFRYVEPQAGRLREFYQTGLELYGAQSPQADAEVVALTSFAVQSAGIDNYQLVLGHIQYFDALVKQIGLSTPQNRQLQFAIARNSEPHLLRFLRDTPLTTQQRRTVEELPMLQGQNYYHILDRAESLCLDRKMYESVSNLRRICEDLERYGVEARIYVDLTEIHNLGYYTGLSFEVLAPQLGFPVGSGGRYDTLLSSFGHEIPAVGVALVLDRLLLTARLQQSKDATIRNQDVQVMVGAHDDPRCHRVLHELRAHNLRVVSAIDVSAAGDICRLAKLHKICNVLVWNGDGFAMYRTDGDRPPIVVHHENIDAILAFVRESETSSKESTMDSRM